MKRKGWLIGGIALGVLCVLLAVGIPLALYLRNKVSDGPENGEGETNGAITAVEHGARADVDLTGYRITYAAGVSGAFREKMTLLGTKLSLLTGSTVTAEASGSGKVIEVRTDTENEDLSGHGFVIRRDTDRISIVGTTALITQMGVDYFMNTYLRGAVVSLPERAVSDNYEMMELVSTRDERYYIVYDADLDTRAQFEDVSISGNEDVFYGTSSETGRDYTYDVAMTVSAYFPTAQLRKDTEGVQEKEILIGRTNRAETAKALALLKGHEYGIMVIDGRVVITGYSTAALHKAAPLFYDYLSDARDAEGKILFPRNLRMIGEASDRWLTDVTLPAGLPLSSTADDGDGVFQYLYAGSDAVNREAYDAYVAALIGEGYVLLTESNAEGSCFKTFTDAARAKMIHVAYNAYAHKGDNTAGKEWLYSDPAIRVTTAYTGEFSGYMNDIKPSDYDAAKEYKTYESGWREVYYYNPAFDLAEYREMLETKGYTVQLMDGVENVLVMRNGTTGERVTARVATDRTLTSGNAVYTQAIAVRYLAPGLVVLPKSTLLDAHQSYHKVTDSKIVSIDLSAVESKGISGTYGTGYVMMLEDGRFVIIDGGASDGGTSGSAAWAQVKNVWSILTSLYKEAFGKEPTPEDPVRIAAWIITHAHGDHMNMFWDFANRYGGGAGGKTIGAYATLDYLIANSPDFTTMYNTGEPNMTLPREMSKYQSYFKDGFTFIKVQTGQHYYFANLEIETLFTPGDLSPQRIVTYNDTSTIQRLCFRSTAIGTGQRELDHKTSTATRTTFLSTGDAYRWSGRWMAAMYGSYLKTDMVSVSHHGGCGFTAEIYDLVSPDTVWWSMNKNNVHSGYSTGSSWYARVDQHLIYDVTSVAYIYVADDHHITLTLGEAGARHDGIYDAVTGEKLSHYVTGKSMTNAQKTDMREKKPVAIHKI